MNNKFYSLLCITVLAIAPACCKKSSCVKTSAEEIRTTIELDNTVFEVEEDNIEQQTAVKF